MKTSILATLLLILISSLANAQHSDINISYEDGMLVLRDGVEGFTDGFQIFTGTFPTSGFSVRFTENPGFLAEAANGDMLLPGDSIELEVLESQTFGSFLVFYDPVSDSMMPTDASLTIEDNAGSNTLDLIIADAELDGTNPQFIQTADSGGFMHSHIDFSLSEQADFGGFGFLFRLVSSNPDILPSQPVWLVFNFGMSPSEFEEFAIPAFVGSNFVLGDVNGDGIVSLLDVSPFIELVSAGGYLPAADINGDGVVNLLDVAPFVQLLTG